MRWFLTGATGFLGGRLAGHLRERGDDVVALVRSRSRAARLEASGCELVEGDLGGIDPVWLEGADVAVHAAAVYAAGAPIVTVMPGGIYGPGDTSQLGAQIRDAMRGKLRYVSFPTLGVNAVYVDDVVAGIVRAADRGSTGREYILGGERTTMTALIAAAAAAGGHKPPRLTIPTWAIRGLAPLSGVIGPALGLPRNLAETIRATDAVTYWGDDARARAELGYAPRTLADGMAALAVAEA